MSNAANPRHRAESPTPPPRVRFLSGPHVMLSMIRDTDHGDQYAIERLGSNRRTGVYELIANAYRDGYRTGSGL